MSASPSTGSAAAPIPAPVHDAIRALLDELLVQAPPRGSWVLDGGAAGLVTELRTLTAAEASRPVIPGRGTIAGHARHVRFFLGLFNAWSRGEDPWNADWSAAWSGQQVQDDEWHSLLDELATEARSWTDAAAAAPRGDVDDALAMKHLVGSVAHVAYHFGAVRQLVGAVRAGA